jgi:hypothetical protein
MKYYQLKPERRYIIERKNTKVEILEGVFVKFVSYSPSIVLMRCMKRKSLPGVSCFGFCYDSDIFYDIEEIKDKSRKAIQSFEKRSLNLILKRLINEEFEW